MQRFVIGTRRGGRSALWIIPWSHRAVWRVHGHRLVRSATDAEAAANQDVRRPTLLVPPPAPAPVEVVSIDATNLQPPEIEATQEEIDALMLLKAPKPKRRMSR